MIRCNPCEYRIVFLKSIMPIIKTTTIVKRNTTTLDVNTILTSIADYCNLSIKDMVSSCRKRPLVDARTFVAYFLQKYVRKLTLKQIGHHLGDRDHTTVIYLLNHYNDMMFTDRDFRDKVNELDAFFNKIFEAVDLNSSQSVQ